MHLPLPSLSTLHCTPHFLLKSFLVKTLQTGFGNSVFLNMPYTIEHAQTQNQMKAHPPNFLRIQPVHHRLHMFFVTSDHSFFARLYNHLCSHRGHAIRFRRGHEQDLCELLMTHRRKIYALCIEGGREHVISLPRRVLRQTPPV